jgi:ABC-type transporter Mla maintaining outer membrane lipid asymmetry ATPase subunit MlaF
MLTHPQFDWTMLIVSNDRDVMQLCDKTILLQDGKVMAAGSYDEIKQLDILHELTDISS